MVDRPAPRRRRHLGTDEIVRVIERISYKPEWTFTPEVGMVAGEEAVFVTIAFRTTDARDLLVDGRSGRILRGHSSTVRVNAKYQLLPWYSHADDLIDTIRYHVYSMEQHETDEWFKYDNVPVRNPHAEPAE